jgi:hypothetical protein
VDKVDAAQFAASFCSSAQRSADCINLPTSHVKKEPADRIGRAELLAHTLVLIPPCPGRALSIFPDVALNVFDRRADGRRVMKNADDEGRRERCDKLFCHVMPPP